MYVWVCVCICLKLHACVCACIYVCTHVKKPLPISHILYLSFLPLSPSPLPSWRHFRNGGIFCTYPQRGPRPSRRTHAGGSSICLFLQSKYETIQASGWEDWIAIWLECTYAFHKLDRLSLYLIASVFFLTLLSLSLSSLLLSLSSNSLPLTTHLPTTYSLSPFSSHPTFASSHPTIPCNPLCSAPYPWGPWRTV